MTDRRDDLDLENYFAAARDSDDRVPGSLVARVMEDAGRIHEARQGGLAGRILRALGGWPSAAGLAAASLVGVLVGLTSPDAVPILGTGGAEALYDLSDLMPGYGATVAFGG